jgi:hypothetical protein
MASHQYTLKRDWQWSIRSDKAAHRWQIYFNAAEMGKPTLTFREARARLLAGIAGGFYEVSQ